MSHAVARLRAVRMARLDKPFIARGSRAPRCPGCRVMFSHCLCALREHRTVLTRDRDLLMLRDISHGCYVHALQPAQQLVEIMARLALTSSLRPFSLCLECNAPLRPIAKSQVLPRLPPSVQISHEHFSHCTRCGRIYWQGSHWERMQHLLDAAIRQAHRQSLRF